MDLRRALMKVVYDRLTTDAALMALFILPGEVAGTVRLVDGMPPPDTKFPYLTYSIDLEVDGNTWAMMGGVWRLDIWDHAPNADRQLEIRHRIITLMDWLQAEPAGGEAVVIEIRFARDHKGPTDAPDVFRLMMEWELFLDRQVEIGAILTR